MQFKETDPRQPRRDCKYNQEERKVIEPFKDAFTKERTRAGCLRILRNDILPTMFTHWVKAGNPPKDDDESRSRAKELTNWLANNWRIQQGLARQSNKFKVKKSEVVWNLHQPDVLKEIAKLLGVEEATTLTKGWFPQRLPAIHNIIDRMSATEKAQLDADVKKITDEGFPENTKRRLAEKNTSKRVEESARLHWMEMGVMSVTFTAYRDPEGKLVIDAHDHIANLASVPITPFVHLYKSEISQMKRLLMQYIKALWSAVNPMSLPIGPNEDQCQKIMLKMTEDGFPILPNPWNSNYSKRQMEALFTLYVGQHYKLATRGGSSHIPFKTLAKNSSQFIAAEYLPTRCEIKDPRNMRKTTIQAFFDHIMGLQTLYGPRKAFRFKAVKGQGGTAQAQYPDMERAGADCADAGCANNDLHMAAGTPTHYHPRSKGKSKAIHTQRSVTSINQDAAGADIAGAESNMNTTLTHYNIHPSQALNVSGSEVNCTDAGYAGADCSAVTATQNAELSGVYGSSCAPPPLGLSPSQEEQLGYITDQAGIDKLFRAGVSMPMPMPINGPADGLPLYMIDAAMYQKLKEPVRNGQSIGQATSKAKQVRISADDLALKEANSALAAQTQTRRRTKKR